MTRLLDFDTDLPPTADVSKPRERQAAAEADRLAALATTPTTALPATALPGKGVAQAILFLAGTCDHARTQDEHGFSRYDAQFGHSLADGIRKYGNLTEKGHLWAKRLCHKYRVQLKAAGFDQDRLQAETWVPLESQAPRRAQEAQPGVVIEAEVETETAKAYKLRSPRNTWKKWYPKAALKRRDDGKWEVARWFLDKQAGEAGTRVA